ncbi:3'-5' exonuclease [Plebeiibacterium sediminum]|uniref:3'-5' exonuclease n=1 Tax=Plebeiibacterium sediminum TaxID=2992112 RepID=A0AAE3SEW9_9BACT|nr:3'-5' exonuclease [Plebeiobacterium sediminum]MCW3786407.1 3'-5' exonuclease domain-containing protein 2 [Plebeiobacterium sediminum]
MVKNTISNEVLNELPLQHFEGEIVLVEHEDGIAQVMKEVEGETVVGFDTETRPSFKKGVTNSIALFQLSTKDSTYLIRLNKTGVPESLKGLLEDESVLKVGVGIRDDIRGLQKLVPFKPQGFVELQSLAIEKGLKDFSLKKLAGILLKFRVSKRQRLSNWEAETLSKAQMVYAATDSWVALEIYKKLLVLDSSKVIDVEIENQQ